MAEAEPVPVSLETLELREALGASQTRLRHEQADSKLLRSKMKTLERQLAELQSWQGNSQTFECDVAAAIQLASRASDNRDDEMTRLRDENTELRNALDANGGPSAGKPCSRDDARKLMEQVSQLETQLRACQQESERSKKELFDERVKTKRSTRDLDAMRMQLRSAREEMGRLYDDLARARHEISRLTVLVTGIAQLPPAQAAQAAQAAVSAAAMHAAAAASQAAAAPPPHALERLHDFLNAEAPMAAPAGERQKAAKAPTGGAIVANATSRPDAVSNHGSHGSLIYSVGREAPAAAPASSSFTRHGSSHLPGATRRTLPVGASGAIAAATRGARQSQEDIAGLSGSPVQPVFRPPHRGADSHVTRPALVGLSASLS